MKSILVTGGSRGIGLAIAQLYGARGHHVIVPSRSELDLASRESVLSWIDRNPAVIDIVVNNAGENPLQSFDSLILEKWDRCFQVNVTSPMLIANHFAAGMRARGWGRVLYLGSVFSFLSRECRGPYATAKTALLGLVRTQAIEWGPQGVLVNAICPGYIETDLTRQNNSPEQIKKLAETLPLRRLGAPEEIARLAFFLGSEENSFVTGQAVVADGGFSLQ